MKAISKTSIMGFLCPVVKILGWSNLRAFKSKESAKQKDPSMIDFHQARGENKRIDHGLTGMHGEADGYKIERDFDENLYGYSRSGFSSTIEHLNEREIYLNHLIQKINADQKPTRIKDILQAIFMADHDAQQLEQYLLENDRRIDINARIAHPDKKINPFARGNSEDHLRSAEASADNIRS